MKPSDFDPKTYAWWKHQLAGNKGPYSDAAIQQGYYGIKRSKKERPQPIVFWYNSNGDIRCKLNGEPVEKNLHDLWMSAMRNAISKETHDAVLGGAEWPAEIVITLPGGESDSTLIGHNSGEDADKIRGNLLEWMDRAAKALKAGVPTTQEEADTVGDLATKLGDFIKEADAERKRVADPIYKAWKDVNEAWNPDINKADKYVKELKASVGVYITTEQRRRDDEARKLREELAAKAAAEAPPGIEVTPVVVTAAPVRVGTRRAIAVTKRKVVEISDYVAAATFIAKMPRTPGTEAFFLEIEKISLGLMTDKFNPQQLPFATVKEEDSFR